MRSRSVRFPGLGNSLIAALVLLFNVAPAAASPVYRVQELLPPSGDVWAFASALNARGEVVGFSFNELGISSALKWWRGSTEVLYPATARDDLRGAQAYDINDLGQAVGTEFGYQPNEFGGVYVAGAGPIVWGAGDIRAPSCDGDDGARQISNASVVLNFRGCAYTIDSADAEFLSPSGSAWERLYENGLVLNGQGTFGQALWGGGPTDEEPWDRGWYVTDLTTCGLPATESMPWDAYVCELANTGYERSRTVNADGQFIVNKDHRAYLYTISEPTSLATAFLLLAILIVLRRNTPLTPA